MTSAQGLLSIVIPVFNEADSIARLHQEVVSVCNREGYDYEIIIVNDGSTDDTDKVIKELVPVIYVRLRRNFGQTAALDCGIKTARGKIIITLDGDGQNDPADIPSLIRHLEENDLDLVSGWRKNRKDGYMKRISSRAANYLRSLLINDGLQDSGCTLKVYKAECFKGISLFGEMHRFIPAVLKIKGFRIGEIEVNHRPRTAGQTKYNWKRGLRGIIDMISVWFWHKYAVRPLHLLGGLGMLSFMLGVIVAVIGIIFYISGIVLFRFFLPILATFLLVSGLQMFLFGLMADMLSKSYFETSTNTSYSVSEIMNNKNKSE
jgi:glycosyltransferase involved in cell wall biosynthesis